MKIVAIATTLVAAASASNDKGYHDITATTSTTSTMNSSRIRFHTAPPTIWVGVTSMTQPMGTALTTHHLALKNLHTTTLITTRTARRAMANCTTITHITTLDTAHMRILANRTPTALLGTPTAMLGPINVHTGVIPTSI